jgi:hypothetical protein
MSHNQFPPSYQCRKWSDVSPDGRALEFVQRFWELCNFCVSLCVRSRQLMCYSEPGMPLKHLRTIQTLVTEGLLNHCECLRSTSTNIGTKCDVNLLFLFLIPRENRRRSRTRLQTNECEKCPRPPNFVQLGTLTH